MCSCHEHSLHVTAHAPSAQCMEHLLRTSLPAVLGCSGGLGGSTGDGPGGGGGTVPEVSGSEAREVYTYAVHYF